jgi:hypothetical protein
MSLYVSMQFLSFFHLIVQLIEIIHIEICLWMFLGRVELKGSEWSWLLTQESRGWMHRLMEEGVYRDFMIGNYVDAADYLSLTITKVGYNNYANVGEGLTKTEMVFIILLIGFNFGPMSSLMESIFAFRILDPLVDFREKSAADISDVISEFYRVSTK